MAMPSLHHDSFAGGLLELESHTMVASMPDFNSSGSMRILTVSGATVIVRVCQRHTIKINTHSNYALLGWRILRISSYEQKYSQCTLSVVDSKRGISVALLAASQRY